MRAVNNWKCKRKENEYGDTKAFVRQMYAELVLSDGDDDEA